MSLQTRLGALITAIGADIKQIKADIAGLSSGGGTDPWSSQYLGTQWRNSTVNAADVLTGFAPVANTRYSVECTFLAYSAAAATGIQIALAGPTTGITLGGVRIQTPITATTDLTTNVGLNGFTAPSGSLVSPNIISVRAIIHVGSAPGAGNIRPQMRSEVAGSMCTIEPGSSMRWRSV